MNVIQVRTKLFGGVGLATTVVWTFARCAATEYSVLSGNDTLTCEPCPVGADCSGDVLYSTLVSSAAGNTSTNSTNNDALETEFGSPGGSGVISELDFQNTVVVQQKDIVAAPGYWASSSSSGLVYYPCPILGTCLSPQSELADRGVAAVVGQKAVCKGGYKGLLCSVCDEGYFQEFGKCVLCPPSKGASIGALFGLSILLVTMFTILFRLRMLLPVDILKLGLSMVQIIASGSAVYDIPWPPQFFSLISSLRLFLVDVVSITKGVSSCIGRQLECHTHLAVNIHYLIFVASALARCVRSYILVLEPC